MSASFETLAHDKQLLIAQSALCRLQLRRRSLDLRQSLTWNRAAVAVTAVPALRRAGFGLVASLAGLDRTARVIRLASRIVLLASLAGSVFAHVDRGRLPPPQGVGFP